MIDAVCTSNLRKSSVLTFDHTIIVCFRASSISMVPIYFLPYCIDNPYKAVSSGFLPHNMALTNRISSRGNCDPFYDHAILWKINPTVLVYQLRI